VNPWNLTGREQEVLCAIAQQGCSKLAARALDIETQTINAHMQNAMRKMGVRGQLRAVITWDRWYQLNRAVEELPIARLDRINNALALRLQLASQRQVA
jgi:DNA-binding CsgD family transcriptional regulator